MSHVLTLLVGLAFLLVGGRLLVAAAVDTARRVGVSPLVIGLTLVAWGTSAPELALNLISAARGRGELALGNVVGANICNASLVLGVSALIRPLAVQERLIRIEIWLNAAILVFMAALGLFAGFQRWEAGALLLVFAAYSTWTILSAVRESRAALHPAAADTLGPDPTQPGTPLGWVMIGVCFVGGLALLAIGGSLCSDGASQIALSLGVSAAIVGVTIVSIGTTLPELTTSVLAMLKGQTDLALGNAVGSCLFNAGAIFGITGLLVPPVVPAAFNIPLIYMALLALALIPISRTFHQTISRLEGGLLLGSYVAFLALSAWHIARA